LHSFGGRSTFDRGVRGPAVDTWSGIKEIIWEIGREIGLLERSGQCWNVLVCRPTLGPGKEAREKSKVKNFDVPGVGEFLGRKKHFGEREKGGSSLEKGTTWGGW